MRRHGLRAALAIRQKAFSPTAPSDRQPWSFPCSSSRSRWAACFPQAAPAYPHSTWRRRARSQAVVSAARPRRSQPRSATSVTFSKISLSECVASAVTVPAACKVKPAGEDRNAPQDFLLGLSKQAIAPIERGTHRVMSWQGRASAARQQPHSVVEAISEPLNSIKRRRGLLQTRSQAEFRPIFTDLSDARTRTPRAPLSVSSAKAAAASITCSQLSSTSSIFRLMPRS